MCPGIDFEDQDSLRLAFHSSLVDLRLLMTVWGYKLSLGLPPSGPLDLVIMMQSGTVPGTQQSILTAFQPHMRQEN